jgi:hypothetical protein
MMHCPSFVVRASGLDALLRVPRPLRGLLLYLRKALSPLALAGMVARDEFQPSFAEVGAPRSLRAEYTKLSAKL